MEEKELQKLLSKAQAGDTAARDSLVDASQDRLFAFLLRLTNNRELAEDLFQETMFRAIRSLDQCRGEMRFLSWLFKIAHRLYIDNFRKIARRQEVMLEDSENETALVNISGHISVTPEMECMNAEFASHLKKAEAALPALEREVYLLYRHSGMTFAEIAGYLECPLNTVLSRMHRAMTFLRGELAQWQDIKESLVIKE